MRRHLVVLGLASLFALGLVGATLAVGESTGTVAACATVTSPAHTVRVDGADVTTIAGDVASNCVTVTYTVPTSTITSTVTNPTTTSSTTTSTTTPTTTTVPAACDVTANPGAGTAQAAVNAATAGQTVCLHGGIYTGSSVNAAVIQPPRSGVTIESYPGETATLQNLGQTQWQPLYVPFGVNDLTISNLKIRGPYCTPACGQTVKIAGSRINLTNVDATNDNKGAQCLLLGGSEGRADDVHVTNSVFHDCGVPNNNELECTYFANTLRVVFSSNVVYNCGSYSIQIYPNSGSGLFEHNTFDGGPNTIRGGLVLGGYSTTSGNEIRFNIFTGVKTFPIIHACFTDTSCTPSTASSAVSGNTVHDNCLWPFGTIADFDSPLLGMTQSNNLHADPLFVDRAAHNYALQAGSPCAGKGAR